MADNRYISNEIYYAVYEENTEVTESTDTQVVADLAKAKENGMGYYSFTKATDIIDEFMFMEVQEGMIAERASRTQVEYLVQRAIQELSYDTLKGIGTLEYELVDGALSIPIPQDCVSINKVSYLDSDGVYRPVQERIFSGDPNAFMQDNEGDYVYDSDGNRIATSPEARERYNENTQKNSIEKDSYRSDYYNDSGFEGKRYGADPRFMNTNGTYVYNQEDGIIYVDSSLEGKYMVVEYVTDGLGEDLEKVKVHKFAEEAVHAYVLWKLSRTNKNVNLGDKDRLRKDWFTTKRNARLRMSPVSPTQMIMAFRGQQKWLKN